MEAASSAPPPHGGVVSATAEVHWNQLDSETRKKLDQEYLQELADWDLPALSDAGVRAYLDYRHERPDTQITTYEEGQIRKVLHEYEDRWAIPEPADTEDHRGWLEVFGAERLHLTNAQTYVAVMVSLTFVFVIALLIFVSLV